MNLPRLLLIVLVSLLVGTACVAALALVEGRVGRPAETASSSRALVAPRPEVVAAGLLGVWDQRRAAAWSRGDPAALTDLYTPRSAAGRHDRAMLRAWLDRGLRVRGMRMQVIALRVVSRSEDHFVLEVTDRLTGGTVVGAGVEMALPRDGATTRTIELRRTGGQWRVASVAPAAR